MWEIRLQCTQGARILHKRTPGGCVRVQVRVRSYASRNQLAAYPGDRQAGQELEWERR